MIFAVLALTLSCPYPDASWVEIRQVSQLPRAIRRLVGALAEPGAQFNLSDVITPETKHLPFKRLIYARGQGCGLEIAYERGGRGYARINVAFVFENGAWRKSGSP